MEPLDRRSLLAALLRGTAGLAGAAAAAGLASACSPRHAPGLAAPGSTDGAPRSNPVSSSPADVRSRAASEPPIEILHGPITLRRGEVLADRRFQLAANFAWTPVMAAVYADSPDVTIRNVHLIGSSSWLSRWNQYNEPPTAPPGIKSGTSGIRLQGAPRVRIEGVHIEGFPIAGIEGFGLDDGIIRDVTVTRCLVGVKTDWIKPNPRMLIERVRAWDLWGPGPGRWRGIGGAPSRRRPGGFTGADGLVLHSLRKSIVRDCEVTGEQFSSIKLVNPQDTEVSGIRGIQLMIQGTSDLVWKIDKQPSTHTRVRDCLLDKRLGAGPLAANSNGMQISSHVHDISIENCHLIAAGSDGHGIQFALDVHGSITGCTFDGWNGMAGMTPAHALDLISDSSANEDFARVNTFVNQKRIVLRR